jgi:hypothetical protein
MTPLSASWPVFVFGRIYPWAVFAIQQDVGIDYEHTPRSITS